MWLDLKVEEEATSQEIQTTSKSWRRKGNGVSPRTSQRNTSVPPLTTHGQNK